MNPLIKRRFKSMVTRPQFVTVDYSNCRVEGPFRMNDEDEVPAPRSDIVVCKGEKWLARLRERVEDLRRMRARQEREINKMVDRITAVLGETEDIDTWTKRYFKFRKGADKLHDEIHAQIFRAAINEGLPIEDEVDVPF